MVDPRAIDVVVCAVKDVEVPADESDASGPVINFVCPVGVRLVAGKPCQTRSDLEESPVGNAVLVIPAAGAGIILPFEAAAAAVGVDVPAGDIVVEGVVGETIVM